MSRSNPIQICHRTGILKVWGLGWWAALYVVFVPGVSGLLAHCCTLMSCHNIRNLVLVPSVLVHVHLLVCSGFDRVNSEQPSSLWFSLFDWVSHWPMALSPSIQLSEPLSLRSSVLTPWRSFLKSSYKVYVSSFLIRLLRLCGSHSSSVTTV